MINGNRVKEGGVGGHRTHFEALESATPAAALIKPITDEQIAANAVIHILDFIARENDILDRQRTPTCKDVEDICSFYSDMKAVVAIRKNSDVLRCGSKRRQCGNLKDFPPANFVAADSQTNRLDFHGFRQLADLLARDGISCA